MVRQLPADVLLGRYVLLGKGVPLLEYTLECMETDEIKQTLQRMLQKGVLNPEAIIADASEKYVLAVETRAQKIKRLEEGFKDGTRRMSLEENPAHSGHLT